MGSFYPGIVFSSLFLIIGRLGSWWWYHLLLSYCFSKIIPSFFTIKKGSTFLTKPLFPQGREDVTALSAVFAPPVPPQREGPYPIPKP